MKRTVTLEMPSNAFANMAKLRAKLAFKNNAELIRFALAVLYTLAEHPGKIVLEGKDGGEDRELAIIS